MVGMASTGGWACPFSQFTTVREITALGASRLCAEVRDGSIPVRHVSLYQPVAFP